jgi:hypothetical protein
MSDVSRRDFFVWIDPNSLLTSLILQSRGEFFSYPTPQDQPLLPFTQNPRLPPADISPFGLGVLKHYVIEHNLELARFERFRSYPSRMSAMFMLHSEDAAHAYQKRNLPHVGHRKLMRAQTLGPCVFSKHDSSWIEFLREDQMLDSATLTSVCNAYWSGSTVVDCEIGTPKGKWTRDPIFETLVVGRVSLSEVTAS